ncbi:3D domain-containing protein [Litoribacterium kuwaitense]|uniref:3D domain-containing protein n=1 Tax=Litoribacterium kuwaitense TaxID=1398745 RepID=UPI0028AE8B08|nr:3D domain-containing protein [Litoribacterium kuwaitense]
MKQYGASRIVEKHYEVTLENGKEVSRTLVEENVVKKGQDKIVALGSKAPVIVASADPVSSQPSRGSSSGGKEIYVKSTAYTAYCTGCSGKTATGYDLRANPDAKVIAVDPNVIPLGTKVYVEGYGEAVAADTGSAIKGNRIDVFFPSKQKAYSWGVKNLKVRILE